MKQLYYIILYYIILYYIILYYYYITLYHIICWTLYKNIDGANADETQSMFILTIFFLKKKNESKIFSRKRNSLINNYRLPRSES